MALFKILKGLSTNLPSTYKEGYCYFTTDDGKMYIDTTSAAGGRVCLNAAKADKLKTARTITLSGDVSGSVSFDGSQNVTMTTTVADNSHNHTITAEAAHDSIVVLTGTNGTNKVKYEASHAKKGPSAGYTSGNTTTSISGSGASKTIKIPQLTVDAYGHVTAAADENVTITMPTIPGLSGGSAASADATVVGGVTVSGHAVTVGKKTLTAGSNVTITGAADKITIASTNTDTKVTAVGNHYAPTADANAVLSVDASSTTSATWGTTDLVTGVNIQRDAKGHVTGVTVDSIQMPANPNVDTKVTQTITTSNASYPLLLAPANQGATATTSAYFDSGVTLNPSTNTIVANISGNAATATSATKATQDGSGNVITSTYLKLAGGTMTGALNFANATWNKVGDDCYIGDSNIAGCIAIKGMNGATGIQFVPYSGSTAQKISINGSGTMTITGTVASTFSGNLSGNATSATLLKPTDNTDTTTYGVSGWGANVSSNNGLIVWRQKFTNSTLGSDTGDIILWLSGSTLLNMTIDGNFYQKGSNLVLDTQNYTSYLDNRYLKLTGGTVTGQVVLQNTADTDVATANSGILLIGTPTAEHISIDGNEIMAKSNGTTAGTLNLQVNNGGSTHIGGALTVGGTTTLNNSLTVAGTSTFNSPIRIGNNASGDTNYIAFYGITGDQPGSYNHTYIGENLWGKNEASELVLFKGNDPAATASTESGAGPDRIRHIAAGHLFQVYTSALSGTFSTICDSTVPVNKFEINQSGASVYGNLTVSGTLTAAGGVSGNSTTTTKLATARTLTIGATGKTFDGSANVSWSPYEMRVTRAQYGADTSMNVIADNGCELGMASLSSEDTTINPGTSWHHYINMTWSDAADNNGSTTNEWCTQIANKCGTTDLWVRSRSGGSITDGTAWGAPWTRILTGSNYTNVLDGRYVNTSGDTMTGVLTLKGGMYEDTYTGALNCNNSNIYGVNSIYTCDLSDGASEGIHFYNTATTVDTIWAKSGTLYFAPNRTLGASGTSYTVLHTGNGVPKTGGTFTGSLFISHTTSATMDYTSTNPRIVFSENGTQPVGLVYSDYDSYRAPAGLKVLDMSGSNASAWFEVEGNIYGSKVYGAVWNDYAEYRSQTEEIKSGYCVASSNSGKVYKTTEMYQACDGITSDTFGFAIGETDECKTPLAVAGRVLAYCAGNRYNYQAGDTVCAGPGGLVYKMTREEIKEYPDRIVGIVSEIPEYETWGSGNIEVDGRIWIKVK